MYLFNQLSINKNYHSKFYFYAKLKDGFILDFLWVTFIYVNHKVKHWNKEND
jgi:hypothetical protein